MSSLWLQKKMLPNNLPVTPCDNKDNQQHDNKENLGQQCERGKRDEERVGVQLMQTIVEEMQIVEDQSDTIGAHSQNVLDWVYSFGMDSFDEALMEIHWVGTNNSIEDNDAEIPALLSMRHQFEDDAEKENRGENVPRM